ncbi:alpha/beta hydrolase family protein [Paenibacillus sp. GCM10027627]|uniref:alpha/beta hydrolase family protein n=1 Tax=unclassified Paenibacillus TaxID=185978 RepID=UPI003636D810
MERTITINGGYSLQATLHYPDSKACGNWSKRIPVVVICHGFVGNRIGKNRLFVNAARKLSGQGFLVLRFDYAGCGESTGDYGTTGFESWIDQTRFVLDYALAIEGVDLEKVTLLGHSLGGTTALLTAAIDKRVRSLVLWSPVAYPFKDIVGMTGRSIYEEAQIKGVADYLGYSLTSHFFASLERTQPFHAGLKFTGDVLLVHGTSDEIIPVDYSFLYQKLFWTRHDGQCDKEIILYGDHTFSSQESTRQLFDKTVDWLQNMERKKREWNSWMI